MAFVGIAVPIHGNVRGADAPTALKSQARPQSPGQAPSTANTGAVRGEWRSREQFGDQPRATVVVHEEDGTLAGTLTLLGMTEGADDRATLRVPFRVAGWDGTTFTFDTALGNEGTTRWVLVVTPAGDATLRPTTEEGKAVEDAPTWAMSRR
jgi:hypothetical protein